MALTESDAETGLDPCDTLISRPAAGRRGSHRWRWVAAMGVMCGPGIIVMLADGDAGCLITAAQSGAQWGDRLIVPSIVLIPLLYMVQEMTVRLGIITGKGHGQLIRECFGRGWSMVSAGPMIVSAVGTLVVEFVGVAGVGELFGVSKLITVPAATVFLIALACGGGYRRIERVGIALGLAELAFVPAMLLAHPSLHHIVSGAGHMPFGDSSYLLLVAANAGAVIMPWMIFYQQHAVVDRGLTTADLPRERVDTFLGALLTQGIMISVMVLTASTIGRRDPSAPLSSVGQIAGSLSGFIGHERASVLIGAGILGGALVSALVVSVAGAWGLSEVFGWRHSLNERPSRRTAKFYISYALAHVVGALLVLFSVDLVALAVDVEILNAMMLPLVLGFLLALERRALPRGHRSRGTMRVAITGLCGVLMILGVYVVIPSI